MSDLGLRIADLKTRRQESGDRSYEAEFRGRKSQIRGQTTEDKKEQNLALQIFDFEIRNSKFYPMPHALCLHKSTIYNLKSAVSRAFSTFAVFFSPSWRVFSPDLAC